MAVAPIYSLFNLGDDAMNTEGMVYIIAPPSIDSDGDTFGASSPLMFRATTYSIPQTGVTMHEFTYRGSNYSKPIPGNPDTKQFTVTFRADKYWKIYDQLRQWKEKIFDATSTGGTLAEDTNAITGVSNNRGTIILKTLDSKGEETGETFTFENAYITSLSEVAFNQAAGTATPLTIEATFDYVEVKNNYEDNSEG